MELKVDVYMKNEEGDIVDIYHEEVDDDDILLLMEARIPFGAGLDIESINVTEVVL